MNYQLLRRDDSYPAVGVAQKLLNRAGAKLKLDGHFGPRTEDAVKAFQSVRGLRADGVIGAITWPRLVASDRLPIRDCIDIFDPDLSDSEAEDIRAAGGNPIVLGGLCNGVAQAASLVASSGHGVFLLRFHGHGQSGFAGISVGTGTFGTRERSVIAAGNWSIIEPDLRQVRRVFGPYGCVQFMHCSTGSGADGRLLLQLLANEWGVPVTAALNIQYGGGLSTFMFEGPTHTALPAGGTLQTWCEKLPDPNPISVP